MTPKTGHFLDVKKQNYINKIGTFYVLAIVLAITITRYYNVKQKQLKFDMIFEKMQFS